MDLLAGYTDSDDDQSSGSTGAEPATKPPVNKPVASAAAPKQQTSTKLPAPDLSGIKLPPPNFDEDEPGSSMQWESGPSGGGTKRGHQAVTGAHLTSKDRGPSKVHAPGPTSSTAPSKHSPGAVRAAQAATLLPPQLRGRGGNVSTEDVGRMFTQAQLAAMQKRKQQEGGAGAAGDAS